jgi:hypothetical protein
VRKSLRIGLICLGVVAAVAVIYDRFPIIVWVGSTDLTVEFVVTDADTGQPVEGADVLILGRTRHEREDREWQLKTDRSGIARGVVQDQTCVGRESGLRFTDTYHVYPVEWVVRVKAPGYAETEPLDLHQPPFRTAAMRNGPRQALLVVPIALRKSAP